MYTTTETLPPAHPRVMLPPPPTPSARTGRTWSRLSWLAGVAVLTASLVGANHVLNSRATADGTTKTQSGQTFSGPPGVVCLGTVDLETVPGGYVPLAPTQLGEVMDIPAHETQTVKKGDVLLRVDDEVSQLKLAQAETGVRLAEAQLTQARQLTEKYKAGVDAQTAAVDSAKHKISAAQIRLERQERLLKLAQSNDEEIRAARQDLEAAKSLAAAEEAKLRDIQSSKPDAKIQEAAENLAFARQRVDEARIGVQRCSLVAPADGTVLRLNVSKGSVLGPQTRQAPVLFAPNGKRVVRAEVPQEFAQRVQVGMAAIVQDEVNGQMTWQGHVTRLGAAYLPKRATGGPESLGLGGSDERVRECVIELDANQPLPLLGQRVRANIGTHGGP
jgi:multidrug resistance efflux pump